MLLFIGGGKMGAAIVQGLIAEGLSPITVIDPALPTVEGATVISDYSAYSGPKPNAVILAVKPQIMEQVLTPLATELSDQLLISIAAGKSVENLQTLLGLEARLVRAMPNLPAAIGAGMTGWFATPNLTAADKALTQTILSATGVAKEVMSEDQIDAWTAIAGSGPAYIFHLLECMTAAAENLGFDKETATALALETTLGSARLAAREADSLNFSQLRENVTSPGGTTAAGLEVLMPSLGKLIEETAKAALDRARALK